MAHMIVQYKSMHLFLYLPTPLDPTTMKGKKALKTGWWLNQPIWKNMLVKFDHFPKDRGENKKYLKPPPGKYEL